MPREPAAYVIIIIIIIIIIVVQGVIYLSLFDDDVSVMIAFNDFQHHVTFQLQEQLQRTTISLTVEFLQQNVPDFIEPSVWPPNSPDLNPVDYAVWDALQQAMYRYPNPIVSLNDLKDRVRT